MRSHARLGLTAAGGDLDVSVEHFNRNKRGIVLDLRALNPALIYARGSGYGPRGPDAGAGGFDSVSFWSRGGVAYMLSPPEGPPTLPRPALGDGPCGMFLAGGIAAALVRRALSGAPSVVDVSLLADGRFVQLNMLDAGRWWTPACRALGLDDLAADPRYGSDAGRRRHSAELRQHFAEAIARLPRKDLESRLRAEGCIFALVASPTEVVADPQVTANGYLAARPGHPVARLASSPVQFDESPLRVTRAAPGPGEHAAEILTELGFTASEQAELALTGVLG